MERLARNLLYLLLKKKYTWSILTSFSFSRMVFIWKKIIKVFLSCRRSKVKWRSIIRKWKGADSVVNLMNVVNKIVSTLCKPCSNAHALHIHVLGIRLGTYLCLQNAWQHSQKRFRKFIIPIPIPIQLYLSLKWRREYGALARIHRIVIFPFAFSSGSRGNKFEGFRNCMLRRYLPRTSSIPLLSSAQ